MKTRSLLLSFGLCTLLSVAANAESLYAVSMRTYSDPGYNGVEGNLYVVATDTAVTRLLATLTVAGKTPVGLDGLAIHPKTGIFYGITAASSAVLPRSLVTVDPKTGFVTAIGDLGYTGTDIDFDPDGTLYIWLPETRQVGTVNLGTGAATPQGQPLGHGALKGGITLIGGRRGLVAGSGGAGTLDTVDLASGTITTGPVLVGAAFPELMNGLIRSSRGTLYGVNTNGAQPPSANLVSIDAQTGKVTNIGPLPNETDALSFGPEVGASKDVMATVQEWRFPLLVVLFMAAVVIVVVAMRSKKP